MAIETVKDSLCVNQVILQKTKNSSTRFYRR